MTEKRTRRRRWWLIALGLAVGLVLGWKAAGLAARSGHQPPPAESNSSATDAPAK